MGMADDLGWEYFGKNPMESPRMMEHMDWHNDPENRNRIGNYGERFLLFHKEVIDKFDDFRISKGLLPITGWDPTTPIPPALSHDHALTASRDTDFPFSLDPHCATPTWATLNGGTTPDPLYGYTELAQFRSLDELGFSIDSGWHGTVHNTIGGDMATFHSPIDPIFWGWHKWIDNVRAAWVALHGPAHIRRFELATSMVQILFGVINDAPGVGIGPDGKPHPVPGGPGDPIWKSLTPSVRDSLIGLTINELGAMHSNHEFRQTINQASGDLLSLFETRVKLNANLDKKNQIQKKNR